MTSISLGNHVISLNGQLVSYQVRRSLKAKHVRFEIRPADGLTVVVPRSFRLVGLERVLLKKQGWIIRHLKGFSRTQFHRRELITGDRVAYLGRELAIYVKETIGPAQVEQKQDNLTLLCNCSSGPNVLLKNWYRNQANYVLPQKVGEMASRLGLKYNSVTIRSQITRWASCSTKGDLSFNWKLMMVPEPVVDYVIMHELCHLKEMNHTKMFWDLVARHCPDWLEHKTWLKEHGQDLSGTI